MPDYFLYSMYNIYLMYKLQRTCIALLHLKQVLAKGINKTFKP